MFKRKAKRIESYKPSAETGEPFPLLPFVSLFVVKGLPLFISLRVMPVGVKD
jgi:hypothetical protein